MSRKKIKSKKSKKPKLSKEETEVMKLIFEGKQVDDISNSLNLDILETLKILSSIYSKLPESFLSKGGM